MPEKFGLPSDIRGGACAKARFASTTRAINEANIEFRTFKSPFRDQRIPLLAKEGWPRHQEEVPDPKRRGRGGRSEITLRNAF